jgi:hypothetical protein
MLKEFDPIFLVKQITLGNLWNDALAEEEWVECSH